MSFNRRLFVSGIAAAPFATLAAASAQTAQPPKAVEDGLMQFAAITPQASALVVFERPGQTWGAGRDPHAVLFVGSAVKTFILAQALRDVEAKRLSEDDQWAVDDAVRSLVSPVLANLTGTTTGRTVLEAMIAHSDNTATDIALAKVGPDAVRALMTKAGLSRSRIPDSTRRLFSYIAGAPVGEDLGWAGMLKLQAGWSPGPSRPAVNDQQSMLSSSTELVLWYQRALEGRFFQEPETLTEFKRIQAMADAISIAVPPRIAAYGKGGSIDWEDFHCMSFAGQMVSGPAHVTFAFTINWTGPQDGVKAVAAAYKQAVVATLKGAAESFTL